MYASIYPQQAVSIERVVNIYTSCNGSSNPRSLDADDFLAYYLYLYLKFSTHNIETFMARYKGIRVTTKVDDTGLPDDIVGADLLMFFYFTTLFLKNTTDNSLRYQANKVIGLSRAAESYGFYLDDNNYLITSDVLNHVRDFMDKNRYLLADIFACYLSYGTDDRVNQPGADYAVETSKSVEYIYMVGVLMIEKILVNRHREILSNTKMLWCYKEYLVFKNFLRQQYGSKWIFGGLLAYRSWERYKRRESFRQLWIIAGALAVDDQVSYSQVSMDGQNIVSLSNTRYFQGILEAYQKHQIHQNIMISSDIMEESTARQLNESLKEWTSGDNQTESSSFLNDN